MAIVHLSGLPEAAKLQKVVFLFKHILKRDGILKFWMREMRDIRGSGIKSTTIEFDGAEDAYRASKILDGFVYREGPSGRTYPLTARVQSDGRARPQRRTPSPEYRSREREYRGVRFEDHQRYERFERYSRERERSRSPLSRETSKLDMEIELLRKRRLIIEEERRLLLERKKLELVKEFGPSALKEFKSIEDNRERRYRSPERAPRLRRPPPPPPPPPPPRIQPRPNRLPIRDRPVIRRSKLPQFTLPCKLLLDEMQDLINALGSSKEMGLLVKLVRSTIRRRLAIALEGKPILPGAKIVTLYRHKYPKVTDEELIKKHLKELRALHIPARRTDRTRREPAKEDKGQENNEPNAKQHSDTELINVANIKVEPAEQDSNDQDLKLIYDTQGTIKGETGSIGSSEALTLHDKNDEDWVEGVHGWEDVQAAEP